MSMASMIGRVNFGVWIACASIVVSQIANYIFSPALPSIAQDLHVKAGIAQFLMTAFLAAYAAVQIVVGPLADLKGRRPMLIVGVGLLTLGSGLSVAATTIHLLFVALAIQALGAGILPTVGQAMMRDRLGPERTVQVFAILGTVLATAAAATPLIGGLMVEAAGWRAVFGGTSILGVILFVASLFADETVSAADRADHWDFWAAYGRAIGQGQLLAWALLLGCMTGGMAVFFSGAPFLFVHELKMSPSDYGAWVIVCFAPFIAGTLSVRPILKRKLASMPMIGKWGAILGIAGAALGFVAGLEGPRLIFVLIAAGLFNFGLGLVVAIGKGAALSAVKTDVAAASALVSFLTVIIAALISAFAGHFEAKNAYGIYLLMMIAASAGLVAAWRTSPNSASAQP